MMYLESKTIPEPETVTQIVTDLLTSLPADLNLTISQISKDSGVDLYKYQNGKSVPGIKSMVGAFNAMDRCPAWALILACSVAKGNITLEQARSVLKNWDSINGYAEGRVEEIINRMIEHS